MAAGLTTWAVGIATVGYDYDEVMRTHSIWLASQGLCPYRDFLDCHPPYFRILAPIVRTCATDPCSLLRSLRIVGAVGNLLFLGGLVALGAATVGSGRRWALLGLAIMACQPAILEFLVEFRIDGWGYALAAWSLYRFVRFPRRLAREIELGVVTGIATLGFCPKLALLPPLIVLSEQLIAGVSLRRGVRALMAYCAGVGVAAGLFAMYLAWQGIDFDRAYQVLVRYNALGNTKQGLRLGLLQGILRNPGLFGLILAGITGWAVDHIRRRSRPQAYEIGLASWLVLQVVLVGFPYKQYYAPWFLFAAGFLGYLGALLTELLGRGRVVVWLAACTFMALADARVAQLWTGMGEARRYERLIRWMNRVTRPEDPVVAAPPLHPIDRHDTFFVWFNTLEPGGFDSERILAQLPAYQGRVAPGRFREELERHRPALVVLSGDWRMVPYTSGQQEALTDFLRRHGYRGVAAAGAWFALRPDRFDLARRNGLLEATVGGWAVPSG